jgi:hypothetical protein
MVNGAEAASALRKALQADHTTRNNVQQLISFLTAANSQHSGLAHSSQHGGRPHNSQQGNTGLTGQHNSFTKGSLLVASDAGHGREDPNQSSFVAPSSSVGGSEAGAAPATNSSEFGAGATKGSA